MGSIGKNKENEEWEQRGSEKQLWYCQTAGVHGLLHFICAQLENRAEIVRISLSVGEQEEEWCGIVYATGWCHINNLPRKQAKSQGRSKPNQTNQNIKPKDVKGNIVGIFF